MEPILLFVLFAIVIIGLAILSAMQAAKRRKALEKFAHEKGLSFNAGNDHAMESLYSFSILKTGSRRYAYNVMEGAWNNRRISAFDYHYETYSTDSKGRRTTHHHYFSAVVVNACLSLKPLFIRKENFFDKIGEFFGYDDIDFESAEFSKKFCVKSPDKKWAYDVLHQETMEFLLQSPRFTLDFQGCHIIAYWGSTFGVKDFEAAFQVVDGIISRLPRSLIEELKGAH